MPAMQNFEGQGAPPRQVVVAAVMMLTVEGGGGGDWPIPTQTLKRLAPPAMRVDSGTPLSRSSLRSSTSISRRLGTVAVGVGGDGRAEEGWGTYLQAVESG